MSNFKGIRISAVIPAYNEAKRIGEVISEISPYVDEIVVVDDGSRDDTALVAEKSGAHRIVRHLKNKGYIEALKSGFKAATGDILVTVDADGEFEPSDIPRLVAPVVSGQADMVQGHRNVIPRLSERFLSWLANRLAPVGDTGTGFRALKRELAQEIEIRGRCICGVLALEAAYKGARIVEVPVRLRSVGKPRRIAWYHVPQIFHVLVWVPKFLGRKITSVQRRRS